MAHRAIHDRVAESERHLTTLIDNLPGVVYRCRNAPDWPMEFISDGVLDLTGYAATEFVQSRVRFGSLVHAEDRAGVWEGVQAATAERKPYRLQYRLKTANDEEKWVWEQGRGIYAPGGELAALEGFITDITEQKRSEEELRSQASTIRALMESATEAIVAVDREGRIVLANGALGEMFGFSPEEAIGQSVETLLPEGFREAHKGHRAGFFSQPHQRPMGANLELAGSRKDGTEFPVQVSLSYIERTEGLLAVAFISDVTERRQTEETLRTSEERYRSLVENSPDCIHEIDLSGRLISMNRAGLCMVGAADQKDIKGRSYLDLVAEQDRDRVGDLLQRAFAGEASSFEFAGAGTGWRSFSSSFVPVRTADGSIVRIMGISADITDRKRAEEALRESQDQLQRLAGKLISAQEEASSRIARELHDDFGQRLAGLVMQTSVLGRRLSTDESGRQRLQRITKSISELADDCQKISRRMHSSILEKVGLEAALKAECESFAVQVGIEVGCQAEAEPARLEPQAAVCLYRVAQEALRNVAKHAEASRVDVILTAESESVTLRVRDDGVGFNVTSAHRSGGLGFTSMEERARPFGGRISIASEVGKGTTVEVLLPVEREP